MRQLIYNENFNERFKLSWESEFFIASDEEAGKRIGDNHSSPETLIYLGEEYIETLELISYGNFANGIRKVIERKYNINFDEVINFLKDKRLVIYQGRNWMDNFKSDLYKPSPRGLELLERTFN